LRFKLLFCILRRLWHEPIRSNHLLCISFGALAAGRYGHLPDEVCGAATTVDVLALANILLMTIIVFVGAGFPFSHSMELNFL
jgi:hypothetical protein